MKMKMTHTFRKPWLFLLLAAIIGGGIFVYVRQRSALTQRQTMIHENGMNVMPFDLNQTTHIFKKTDNGGIQQIVAKDETDTQQISLNRMHLQMEAGLFQKGDFRDPAKLHGGDMPGLQELSSGASQIKISYADLPNGGQITYATDNKNLVTSIHTWFDAQVSDHGNDAMRM